VCHHCSNLTDRKDILEYYRLFIDEGIISKKDYIKMYIDRNTGTGIGYGDFSAVFFTDIQPEELFPNLTKEQLEKLLVLL
jgi:hypothetical protein